MESNTFERKSNFARAEPLATDPNSERYACVGLP
jgi:hypothetical protein